MVERTEPIRQDIEATRAAMTDKLEQIEGQVRDKVDTTMQQARQALDVRHQVNERPWMAVGAALTLGFIVGSMGGDDDEPQYPQQPGQPMRYYSPPSGHWSAEERYGNGHAQSGQGSYQAYGQSSGAMSQMSQLVSPVRQELSLMATAAVRSAMRVLRESLQESIPQFDTEYRAVQHEREDEQSAGQHEQTGHPQQAGRPEQRANAVGGTAATMSSAPRTTEEALRARQTQG